MKRTSRSSRLVSSAARSPALAITGPGGGAEADAHLLGHDLRQRGLAETGRAGEEYVIERIAARAGGLNENLEIGARLLLARKVVERLRPDRRLEGVGFFLCTGEQAIVGHGLFVAGFGRSVKRVRMVSRAYQVSPLISGYFAISC